MRVRVGVVVGIGVGDWVWVYGRGRMGMGDSRSTAHQTMHMQPTFMHLPAIRSQQRPLNVLKDKRWLLVICDTLFEIRR